MFRHLVTLVIVGLAVGFSAPLEGQTLASGCSGDIPYQCDRFAGAPAVPTPAPVPAARANLSPAVGWGILAGIAAGVAAGYYLASRKDEYVGPSPFVFTVPIGVVVGGAIGWVVGEAM